VTRCKGWEGEAFCGIGEALVVVGAEVRGSRRMKI
jgi:hypothetical protein